MTLAEGSFTILPLQDKFPFWISILILEREKFNSFNVSETYLSIRHFAWSCELMNVIQSGPDIIMNNITESDEITPNKRTIISVSSLRLIKLASIIMGILIILGVIALIFGIQQKLSKKTENIVELSVPLKQGQVIRSVDIDASGGILLWIGNPEASVQKQTILHVDRSGAIRTRFFITTF